MESEKPKSTYIIATPIKNEVKYIEATMKSVIKQTVKPLVWLLVSDESTDGTDELIERYAKKHSFIKLLPYKYDGESELISAKKAYAARYGLANTKYKKFDFFCGMDADVTFPENLFEELLKRCEADPKLGVTGGHIYNVFEKGTGPYFNTDHSIGGPLQFFRRKCYEDIGGWQPVGMEDGLAVTSARMHGWKARSWSDLRILHHKPSGIKGRNIYKFKFILGRNEYLNGDHPAYHFIRSFRYLFWRPILIGPFLRIAGFWKAKLSGQEITTPEPLRSYLRKEQLRKLNIFKKFEY